MSLPWITLSWVPVRAHVGAPPIHAWHASPALCEGRLGFAHGMAGACYNPFSLIIKALKARLESAAKDGAAWAARSIACVADPLQVSAVSGDGLVEGLEDPSRRFYLGVQWHPEYLDNNVPLFEALVAAAK